MSHNADHLVFNAIRDAMEIENRKKSVEPKSDIIKVDAFFVILAIVWISILCSACCAETGIASYYTVESCHKEGTSGRMANGELLKDTDMVAASWFYPFGARLVVRNTSNNKSCVVTVKDRGPAKSLVRKGRIIDLSKQAMLALDGIKQGVITVSVEKL